MTMLIRTLAAAAAATMLATSAFAQSAREIRGGSPYNAIENELNRVQFENHGSACLGPKNVSAIPRP